MSTVYDVVKKLCLGLPETEEAISHGFPNFKVAGKTFATYSLNHHGDGKVALLLNMSRDMQQMVENQKPKECAAWTMELDFTTWCATKDRHPDTIDFLDYQEYCDDVSLPLIFQSEEKYAPLCIRAARNTYLM